MLVCKSHVGCGVSWLGQPESSLSDQSVPCIGLSDQCLLGCDDGGSSRRGQKVGRNRPARLCGRPPFRRVPTPVSDADGRAASLTPPIPSSPPGGGIGRGPCLAGGPYLWDPRSMPQVPGAWGGSGQARRAREGLPSMMHSQPGVRPSAHLFCLQICLGASAGPDPWPPTAQGTQYRCAPRLPTCWRVPLPPQH